MAEELNNFKSEKEFLEKIKQMLNNKYPENDEIVIIKRNDRIKIEVSYTQQ